MANRREYLRHEINTSGKIVDGVVCHILDKFVENCRIVAYLRLLYKEGEITGFERTADIRERLQLEMHLKYPISLAFLASLLIDCRIGLELREARGIDDPRKAEAQKEEEKAKVRGEIEALKVRLEELS
jgi:hypothetical protein